MHISKGLECDNKANPYEDFYYDLEFMDLLQHFSTGDFGDGCEVELILNGDVFDFLSVDTDGEFPDMITEAMGLDKLQAIFDGHPELTQALRDFIAKPQKRVVYNIGNHDPEFYFPKVRNLFCEVLGGPDWKREKVWVNAEEEFLSYPEGIEIHHGNLFEAVHQMDCKNPTISSLDEPILAIPWGTIYVLKIINRVKRDREYIDKVKPIKVMIIWGLLSDTAIMLRFMFLTIFYFLRTRFVYSPFRRVTLWNTAKIMKQEFTPFHGLDPHARELLDKKPHVHTVIFGHTHGALQQRYTDGKTYINTGTWTRMVNLDLRHLGQSVRLTFALIEYDENGQTSATLREWMGIHTPHKIFNG